MTKTHNSRSKIVEATLDLARAKDWNAISLQEIAAEADISLGELYDSFDDKFDILAAYSRMIDRKVLADIKPDQEPETFLTPRDRLFDVLMARLDVLNENREAVKTILRSFRYDPKLAVISMPSLGRSMSWMLEAARINTRGIKGAATVAGLSGLYLRTLWVWCDDETADMGQTMAALDKYLGRAERWAGSLGL